MTKLIIGLAELQDPNPALVGQKVARLAALQAAGFPVPAGLCVTTAAYSQAFAVYLPAISQIVDSFDLQKPVEAETAAGEIGAILQDLRVPDPEA